MQNRPIKLLCRTLIASWVVSAVLTGCGEDATNPGGTVLDVLAGQDVLFSLDTLGKDGSTQDATQPDATGTDAAPTGCKNDSECSELVPGVCQTAKCQSGKCALVTTPGASCDDGNACTTADQCKSASCAGTAKKCDDNNPCTTDSCDQQSGSCKTEPVSGSCDDGNFCTQNDTCEAGQCKGSPNPLCNCQSDDDCKKSDDADLCNGINTCQNNQCKPKAGSEVVCDSSQPLPCQLIACDPADGKCKTSPQPAGSACSDGDACTQGDTCAGTSCSGKAVACDDKNPCTTDSCDKQKGCVFAPNTAACDDGDLCTKDDACAAGKCSGTANPTCNTCQTDADCAKFENGNLCDGVLACTAGTCQVKASSVVVCVPPSDPCKTSLCQPTTGICEAGNALDGDKCDDGDTCTSGDRCEAGQCAPGKASACDDANPCTTDSCDKALGCQFTNNTAACDDGNGCTAGDVCADGKCVGTASGSCNSCQTDADCAGFEDGNLCNGKLTCLSGACVVDPKTVVVCDTEGLSPCVQVACLPESGACKKQTLGNGTACDDQNACTQKDFCSSGFCKGTPVVCDDGKLCTDDACDPDSGCAYQFNTAPCDDGNACSTGDACKQGTCSGTPAETCVCSKDSDCIDDGDLCNGTPICVSQKCVTDPKTVVSCPAPADSCSTAACVPATGKCATTAQPDGKSCSDANACTEGDACQSGTCTPAKTISCDDGNGCTTDSCNPAFGCTYTSNTAPCNDGNICTSGDACAFGQCQPGSPVADASCSDKCVPAWPITCGDEDAWSTEGSGATNVVSQYACNKAETYDGAEYTYTFVAPYDCKMTASLTNETALTDVIILDGNVGSCDGKACLAWGYASATVQVQQGKTYYVVVDSVLGAAGKFTLNLGCVPLAESACEDGVDDDQDGKTDCADSDCKAAEACKAPQCDPAFTLACGGSDTWATYDFGSTNVLGSYPGCNSFAYSGPEYTYAFTATTSGKVKVSLSDESAQTDLLVLQAGAEGNCAADQCLAYAFGSEGVSFDAVAGQTYYFVVDGWQGAEGTYTISVACGAEPEVCGNGNDDDNNGAADCEDAACFDSDLSCAPACVPDTAIAAGLSCPTDSDLWDTTEEGATQLIDSYGCAPTTDYSGPEYVYTYVAEADGNVSIDLVDAPEGLDVIVLQDKGLGCNPASCITATIGGAEFAATKGTTYYIVVDGFEGAAGEFELAFSCL